MSGRIPWSRYSGEEVEKVLAAYICLENPRATRIRPSQGDKGIDLIAKHDDDSIVYQIKKFSENLTSSQKNQIEGSWKRLQAYVSENDVKLSEWHLVKLFGGVYDDRFLVKGTPAARAALSAFETPYEGAAPMLLVDTEDRAAIAALVTAMLPELPEPRERRK